ncbi:S8 family serine peptidase [Candidatus Pacearchaeota archaeon]|nr:S8 family serine peptidase [Candidatus Pacearchaeota archaeon]
MKRTTIVLACFISFIFIISIIASGIRGESVNSHRESKAEDKVFQELENNDKVRVIVELKSPEEIRKGSIKSLSQRGIEALKISVREESINLIGKEKVKHRFSSLNGFSAILAQDDIRNLQANENVKKIYYDYPVKAFLQDSVSLMNATRTWQIVANGTNLTGKDESICVIDTGVNYSHPDLGACAIKNLSLEGNVVNYTLESEHNYSNDYNNTWKINYTGFSRIAVHFANISLEYQGEFAGQDAYDRVIIYSSNGTEIASYHGINGIIQDVWTPYSDGDTIFVRLSTDAAVTDYGFYIDQIINGTTNTTYNWSSCSKIIYGWDFVNNDADPIDDNGHGTHVAGIITANGSIKGTAPDSKIIAVKTLDSGGGGWGSDTLYGIEFCTNNSARYNISVISMSLGSLAVYSSYCNNDALAPSINAAIAKNISVVVATGNIGSTTGISSPACVQNATAVGATDKNDAIAGYTNRNNLTDLLATGSSINSTSWLCPAGFTNCANGYAVASGTSMSAPHASAAFALLRQFKRLGTGSILTPAEIEDKLNDTGRAVYDSSTNRNYPRIDIFSAIASLDATAPNVTIVSPQNATYNTRQILVNISASDNIAIQSVWYSWNNTNYTYTISAYANFSEGSNTIIAYANDSANNANSTNVVFSIDTIAPAITIISPQNATYNTSALEFNVALNEAGSSCSFSLDNAANASMAMFNATYFNYTKTGMIDGSHNITFSCNDTLNNMNTTALRHFSINAIPPQLTLVSPQDNSFANQAAQNFTCNATTAETTILRNITFYIWNSSSVVYSELKNISGLSNSTAFNFSFSAEAGYKWNCLAHNDIRSASASANFSITYDITKPALTLHSPANNSWSNSGRFNVSLNENGSCSFSIDNGANVTMTKINSTYFNYTNSALAEAQHNITFYCNDSAGNLNSSANILFIIDATVPAVTLNSPASSYSTSSTGITFSYNASDSGAISSCRLLIDSSTYAYNSTSVSQSSANEIAASDISRGSHTWQVNCIDAALNEGIPSLRSFTITSSSSSSSSSSSTSSNSGNNAPTTTASDTRNTYTLTGNQLKEGYTKEITKKDQFKVDISGENHLVKLSDLTETAATIDVSSTTQTATLSVGEEKKFDVTEDNYYDLSVRLNSLNKAANKANFTIKSINESISAGINNTAPPANNTAETNARAPITAKPIADIIGKILNYKNTAITIGILIILTALFMFIKKIRKWK